MASPAREGMDKIPGRRLRIGVMAEAVQLSDIVGIDIFGNMSKQILQDILAADPSWAGEFPLARALDITWYYMSSSTDPFTVTPGMQITPNTTYDNCPRDLDIVIIGGPLPNHRPAQADRFMKEAWQKTPVWLTVCTGSMWLASSGVLDGRKATTNRLLLPTAKQLNPGVDWIEQRWVVEEKPFDGVGVGELWTAGGAGAGIEMIANYCMQKFEADFVKGLCLSSLEFDPAGSRGQFYDALYGRKEEEAAAI